jgi:hypothetical protein
MTERANTDSTPLPDGQHIADTLSKTMGLEADGSTLPGSDSVFAGIDSALRSGLDTVAEEYGSDDPTKRANATRVFRSLIDVQLGTGQQDPHKAFLGEALAPEELRSSLAPVAQTIGGESGDKVRAHFGISATRNHEKTPQEPKYTGEESLIVAMLVTTALDAAREGEEQDKLVMLDRPWSETNLKEMAGMLSTGEVTPDSQYTLVQSVAMRLAADMKVEFETQREARRAAWQQSSEML